jgi:hypothetical protein
LKVPVLFAFLTQSIQLGTLLLQTLGAVGDTSKAAGSRAASTRLSDEAIQAWTCQVLASCFT